jgi:hypothetical protein
MKKDMLRLVMISSLMAPQGILWATDTPAPAKTPTTDNYTSALEKDVNYKTETALLQDENTKIKSSEEQIAALIAQYDAAVQAGDTTKANALKNQINTERTQLHVAFNIRNNARQQLHQVMLNQNPTTHDLNHPLPRPRLSHP